MVKCHQRVKKKIKEEIHKQPKASGGGCSKYQSRNSLEAHEEECGETFSLQPMEDYMGADTHTAGLREPHSGAGGHSLWTASEESPEALKCMDNIHTRT